VWEVRIPLGPDPVTGRTRSATVHGTSADPTRVRTQLRAECADVAGSRSLPPGPLITVAELLPAWLAAEHPWKPSTVVGYRSTVKALVGDAVADLRVMSLSPRVVRDRVEVWARTGVSPAALSDGVSVSEVAQQWGVSRQSVHAWLRRYEDEGLAGLEPRELVLCGGAATCSCRKLMRPASLGPRVSARRAHRGDRLVRCQRFSRERDTGTQCGLVTQWSCLKDPEIWMKFVPATMLDSTVWSLKFSMWVT
jgi:transposase-like protein